MEDPSIVEARRKTDFRNCPILSEYIATMLQDLQYTEMDEACTEEREERDTGTIWDLEESTYQSCKQTCEKFWSENQADIQAALALWPGEEGLRYASTGFDEDRIGSRFYLLQVGHGVSFTDDGDAECLVNLNNATRAFRGFDAMIGDDGEVYTI